MTNNIIKTIVEAPARILSGTIDESEKIGKQIQSRANLKKAGKYWKLLGPGLTTGAADDDPSGIATYSQTGAQYGFQLLWLSGFTFPLMAIVQEMCARIGLVTGRGLAANIRHYCPRWVLYSCTMLLFSANALNIGADLGAMAKATQLLRPELDFKSLVVGFAVVCVGLQIFTTYERYAKYLKWMAMVLLSYVFVALIVHLDWNDVIKGTIFPTIQISSSQLILICAILGTTISPYLFFWQTSQEIEEEIRVGKLTIKSRQITSDQDIRNMRIDVWSGMFVSNIVMFFIIAACAAILHKAGVTNIATAADAAVALEPLAGPYASWLFTLGIIGTGMLALPVLAGSSAYAVSESLGWKYGLYRKLKEAYAFYGVIIISTLVGILIPFLGIDPIKALIYSAIANGLVAPIILALIVLLSSNKKIMGKRKNHPVITSIGWIIVGLMTIAGIVALVALATGTV